MIRLGRLNDVGKKKGEECLLIVRRLSTPKAGARQETLLAPSEPLFRAYRAADYKGKFNESWFQQVYVPQFLQQMASDMEARRLLDKLYRESQQKDILLACFCPDESLCHRSIIGGLLLGAGADIECKQEYVRYWEMFKGLMKAAA